MSERTAHPNLEAVVWPLYLPQIYWVLLRNLHIAELRRQVQEPGRLPKWESEFISALSSLGLTDPAIPSEIWTDDFSKEVLKHLEEHGAFRTKKELSLFLEERLDSGPNKLIRRTNRIDRKVVPAAEAIGLFAFHKKASAKLQDTLPTPIFDQLFSNGSSGTRAAALMLARFLTIPESTWTVVRSPPRELLTELTAGTFDRSNHLAQKVSQEHPGAPLDAYVDAVRPWFSDPLKHRETVLRLLNLINPVPSLGPSWRWEIPNEHLVTGILRFMGAKEQDVRAKKSPSGILVSPQAILIMGPPGTGKTTVALQLAQRITRAATISPRFAIESIDSIAQNPLQKIDPQNVNVSIVQFHQSYGYEDFVEGLRPTASNRRSGTVRYAVTSGPFKAFAELARSYWEHWNKVEHSFRVPVSIYVETTRGTSLEVAPEFAAYDFLNRPGELHLGDIGESPIARTGNGRVQLLEGAPPRGAFLVFWKPTINADSPPPNFVLVIDELNRGNPSKIFGEALSLIESTKRMGHGEAYPLLLPYSRKTLMLTDNLHIIATMNQADRSLAPLDQAFRRRFTTRVLTPNLDLVRNRSIDLGAEQNKETNKIVADHIEHINRALAHIGIDDEKHIGHFYAIRVLLDIYVHEAAISDALERLWVEHLHPLLRDSIPKRDREAFVTHFQELERDQPFQILDLVEQFGLSDPAIDFEDREAA